MSDQVVIVLFQLESCIGDVRVDQIEVVELRGDATTFIVMVLHANALGD